jgi:hypothetical protein
MESPVTVFLAWYQSLPVHQRQYLAEFASAFNPGFEEVHAADGADKIAAFTEFVRRYENEKARAVGLMLTLRASVDFFFVRGHGSSASWDERRAFLAEAQRHFASDGNDFMVEQARTYAREIEFQEAQSLVTAEKWRQLVAANLSDESLDAWWRPSLAER